MFHGARTVKPQKGWVDRVDWGRGRGGVARSHFEPSQFWAGIARNCTCTVRGCWDLVPRLGFLGCIEKVKKWATDHAAILVNAVSEVSLPLQYVPLYSHGIHCTRVHAFCCARTVRMRCSAFHVPQTYPPASKVENRHP